MKEIVNNKLNNKLIDGVISIIVPVYNAEKYLSRCIESIIGQTYKKIEIILIDDGSTDNSGKISDTYAENDKRVRVIHTENNGPSAARNRGIKHSRGEFLFFVDSDDFIENNAISLLMKNYNQHKADIIIGDFNKINDNNPDSGHGRVFPNSKLLTKQDIIDYVKCYLRKPNRFPLFVYSWGRLFKSSIIKNNNILFNTDLWTFEDVAFNFNYLKYTNKLFFVKKTIYNHLIHDNYTSAAMRLGSDPEILFGYSRALAKAKDFLRNYYSDDEIKKEIGHAYICYTIIQLVRTCGQINNGNKKKIYSFIRKKINNSNFKDNLQFYFPLKGDSRILPILMKLKLVWPIIWLCKYKARKRYKKI